MPIIDLIGVIVILLLLYLGFCWVGEHVEIKNNKQE